MEQLECTSSTLSQSWEQLKGVLCLSWLCGPQNISNLLTKHALLISDWCTPWDRRQSLPIEGTVRCKDSVAEGMMEIDSQDAWQRY